MSAYTLHQELRFTVCEEEFSLTKSGEALLVEETRKNGQEDCHMSGELVQRDGVWGWSEDWGRKAFDQYGNSGVADAIPAYPEPRPRDAGIGARHPPRAALPDLGPTGMHVASAARLGPLARGDHVLGGAIHPAVQHVPTPCRACFRSAAMQASRSRVGGAASRGIGRCVGIKRKTINN